MATIPNYIEFFQPRDDPLGAPPHRAHPLSPGRSPSPGPPFVPWALPLTGPTLCPLGAPPHRAHPLSLRLNLFERNLPCLYVPSSFFITCVVCWLNFFKSSFLFLYLHNQI